jgi:hypothetical protein
LIKRGTINQNLLIKVRKKQAYKEFGSVDVFLHWMLCSYLNGNFEEAKKWLGLLRKMNSKYPEMFYDLDQFDRDRLLTISKALTNGEYISKLGVITSIEEKTQTSKESFSDIDLQKEKQLVKLLIHNEELFQRILGFPDMKLACLEQETNYGNVDIVAYSKLYAIPIEVKLNKAYHPIVGQISKYMKYFFYKINYKIWRDVVGVTIAQDYSEDALQELRKINVIPLVYSVINEKLVLKRI